MQFGAVALLVLLGSASALLHRENRNATAHRAAHAAEAAVAHLESALSKVRQNPSVTFESFYNAHSSGRGIWKWSNAIAAYQRHFGGWAGQPVKLGEVGIQSGGSIDMWQATLGPQCHVYGLDINPQVNAFANPTTTITIGDQADPAMWNAFFTTTTPSLDILIDDGGHEPHQMLTTLAEVFYRLSPGGFIAIEDIHGPSYIQTFFAPAANYLAHQATTGALDSVHVYPYLLIAQRAGSSPPLPRSELAFGGPAVTVDSFDALMAAVPQHPGGVVVLENPSWGSFFSASGLSNFFAYFGDLHAYSVYDTPPGCATTSAAVCTNTINSSPMQAQIIGVHIYATRLVVEVAGAPVVIHATRRGDTFLSYR